jgi:hypothetical protein
MRNAESSAYTPTLPRITQTPKRVSHISPVVATLRRFASLPWVNRPAKFPNPESGCIPFPLPRSHAPTLPLHKEWEPRELKLLGKVSDQEAARRLKRSLHSVKCKRVLLRIPNWQLRGKLWTRQDEALVGTMSDVELAKKLGRTVRSIEHKRAALGLGLCRTHRCLRNRDRSPPKSNPNSTK